jgi:hypothetical protein
VTNSASNPGWRKAGLIDVLDDSDVEYWMKVLDCTQDELVKAVKSVGTSAEAVRKKLRMDRMV